MDRTKKIRLFALDNSQKLGRKVSDALGVPLSPINKTVFKDGEMLLSSAHTVRNREVFVVCAAHRPVNESIMEILVFVDSLKRASAASVNVVMTYFGYARQDRKSHGREPISAKMLADILQVTGISRLTTVDLHNPSIQGFFTVPVDDLRGQYILAHHVLQHEQINPKTQPWTVVSPDQGGVVRAATLANLLGNQVPLAVIDKSRHAPNESKINGILGNVKGRNCLIVDDIIDTGGTIVNAAEALSAAGAKSVWVTATHGLFSAGFQKFDDCAVIKKVVVTDSLQGVYKITSAKLQVATLAPFLAQIVSATHNGFSLTSIYDRFVRSTRVVSKAKDHRFFG